MRLGLRQLRTGQALLVLAALLLASACGTADTTADAFTLPHIDATMETKSGADVTDDVTDDAAGTDAAVAETALDVALQDVAPDDVVPDDTGPADAPPQFKALTPLTVAEGASTTLDLNPLLSDLEDSNDKLKVTWSAQHVALKDPGTHVLYVVAPTNWTGLEQIDVTVHDSAGLTATQTLNVTVTEVKVDPGQPVDTCGIVKFALALPKGQHTVLLTGSFNGWASAAPAADVLTDPGSTGTWSVQKKLAQGVYQYKFIVDGAQPWQPDPTNPNQVPDGYGGKNSVVEVPQCTP